MNRSQAVARRRGSVEWCGGYRHDDPSCSDQRVPQGQSPVGYAGAPPEIVFEVVSPTNTRRAITEKIGENVKAGVNVNCVVDPQH